MAKASYRNRGETIEYINSTDNTIEFGTIVSLTTRVGVIAADIPAGEEGRVNIVGVFAMPKGNISISQGDAVYFSTSTNKVTKTNTDVPCGFAVRAATQSDDAVYVKIG